MSRKLYTSDLHFGHEVAAKERTRGWVLPRYVGAEIDAHDRVICERWRANVNKDDTVYVCGDISSGAKQAQLRALELIEELPGEKILIVGNHDGPHGKKRDAHKWAEPYRKVFKDIQPFQRVRFAHPSGEGSINVMLSHFPYDGDAGHSEEDRHTQYRLRDEGLPVIHGHVHRATRITRSLRNSIQVHVGLDAWNLTPVPHEGVQQFIWNEVAKDAADELTSVTEELGLYYPPDHPLHVHEDCCK